MPNPEVAMTLREAVQELHGILEGRALQLVPEMDKFQTYTHALNRALRAVAREHEWSYYSSVDEIGLAQAGTKQMTMRSKLRARIISDDAVRLVDGNGIVRVWAYWVPRDSLHKWVNMQDLKAAYTRSSVEFNRPFTRAEDGLTVQIPVMREPIMFRLPEQPQDLDQPLIPVSEDVLEQLVDFDYPDAVIARAAHMYAQTNAMYQPRVPTLEEQYNDIKYALVERDDRATDTPMQNEWDLGISGSINGHARDMSRPRSDLSPWG